MENKVKVINNTKKEVNITVDQVGNITNIIIESPDKKIQLSELKPGDVFKGNNGAEFIFLETTSDGNVAVLRKDLLDTDMKFGKTNNFDCSCIDEYLNGEYINEIEKEFGVDNIVEHEVNLLSMDGLDDYGTIRRKVSLLSFDMYRKHRRMIGKNMERSWWLADPDSTPSGYGSDDVRYVDSCGYVDYDWCDGSRGVRPFLILKSSILVSLINTKE